MKEKVNDALKQHFRPEFLNRIDEIIVFHELSHAPRSPQIVDLMIKRTADQLMSQGLGHRAHPEGEGVAGPHGLRPDPRRPSAAPGHPAPRRGPALSERILYKEFHAGEIIVVDVDDEKNEIVFRAVEGFDPGSVADIVEAAGTE